MKKSFTLLLLVFTILVFDCAVAQEDVSDTVVSNTPALDPDDDYRYLLLPEEADVVLPAFKPIIGVGRGILSYYGDVRDVYVGTPNVGRMATNFNVNRNLNTFLKFQFSVIYGTLGASERTLDRNLNFQTDFLNGGVNLNYNFEHLFKNKNYFIKPYVSLGIEYFDFSSKADMYDANGYRYHYWTDGTIRNISESSDNEQNSILLQRDYNYETDIREGDNDNLGKYSQIAFAIPIDVGVDFEVTNRVTLRLGTSFHYSLNNLVDDVSDAGSGVREGAKRNDHFLYSYATLNFDLFSPPKLTILDQQYMDVDFIAFDLDDEDYDRVRDWDDECPFTPVGVKVYPNGCPIDDDDDGIPNYKDKELDSPKGAFVDIDGVKMTEEALFALDSEDGVDRNEICDHYPRLCNEDRIGKITFADIPEKYKGVDKDGDNYISIDELLESVDDFFDFESEFTIDNIYELNEFFFQQ